jgi:hypothetical protein
MAADFSDWNSDRMGVYIQIGGRAQVLHDGAAGMTLFLAAAAAAPCRALDRPRPRNRLQAPVFGFRTVTFFFEFAVGPVVQLVTCVHSLPPLTSLHARQRRLQVTCGHCAPSVKGVTASLTLFEGPEPITEAK